MDLDSIIADMEEVEARDNGTPGSRDSDIDLDAALGELDKPIDNKGEGRIQIGTIKRFFSKIGVIAITLDGTLKIGDAIEIDDNGKTVRETVESMQIDGSDVDEAHEGDSVGIKVSGRAGEGSKVYRIRD